MSNLDEKEFDAYLKGGSPLSQAYTQLKEPEIPRNIDEIIHRESKKGAGAWVIFAKRFQSARLDSPLAMAAVVVLCVSLVLVFSVNETELDFEKIQQIPISSPVVSTTILQPESMSSDDSSRPIANNQEVAETTQPPMSQALSKKNSEKKSHRAQLDEEFQSEVKSTVLESEGVGLNGLSDSTLAEPRTEGFTALELSEKDMGLKLKKLLNTGQVEQASAIYKKFKENFSKADLSNWLTEQEISLLEAK